MGFRVPIGMNCQHSNVSMFLFLNNLQVYYYKLCKLKYLLLLWFRYRVVQQLTTLRHLQQVQKIQDQGMTFMGSKVQRTKNDIPNVNF